MLLISVGLGYARHRSLLDRVLSRNDGTKFQDNRHDFHFEQLEVS